MQFVDAPGLGGGIKTGYFLYEVWTMVSWGTGLNEGNIIWGGELEGRANCCSWFLLKRFFRDNLWNQDFCCSSGSWEKDGMEEDWRANGTALGAINCCCGRARESSIPLRFLLWISFSLTLMFSIESVASSVLFPWKSTTESPPAAALLLPVSFLFL